MSCDESDNNSTSNGSTGAKIVASDGSEDDRFGSSVSISGDYVIVGTENAEAVYIYHRTEANIWDSGFEIANPNAESNDYFGRSVSISGDYAIVGAFNAASQDGIAYIYHRTHTNTWELDEEILSPDRLGSQFGSSVSIDGDYAIVGAANAPGVENNTGAAYIYRRTGTNTWDTGQKIFADDGASNDCFGTSVSINGAYVIVGAELENEKGEYAGAAYIFHRTGENTWDAGVKIVASDGGAEDRFGFSVSIYGDYAVAGSYGQDEQGSNAGAAYIFHRTGTNTWDAGQKITASNAESSDKFGKSVSLYGEYVIIGAENADTAYIFHRTDTGTWDEERIINQNNNAFGSSVSISADYVIIGADDEYSGASEVGAAYIYSY
ncbi:MAG TPA: hypothetical protein PK926_02920 [Spirochaetota bacterium]|nr:hypothetical protein [Spirochaetota bacterium]HPI87967.1 hypothetical protein [Spirochaetota bacterium]HPR46678.1 hypothetical protein [Spirochaetota bacterium]